MRPYWLQKGYYPSHQQSGIGIFVPYEWMEGGEDHSTKYGWQDAPMPPCTWQERMRGKLRDTRADQNLEFTHLDQRVMGEEGQAHSVLPDVDVH